VIVDNGQFFGKPGRGQYLKRAAARAGRGNNLGSLDAKPRFAREAAFSFWQAGKGIGKKLVAVAQTEDGKFLKKLLLPSRCGNTWWVPNIEKNFKQLICDSLAWTQELRFKIRRTCSSSLQIGCRRATGAVRGEVVEALDCGDFTRKYEAGDGRGLAAYDRRG